MIFLKGDPNLWSTRQSDVNPNTLIENLYLETFFRYVLSDVLSGKILNFRQKQECAKILQNPAKTLADGLFEVKERISVGEMVGQVRDYLKQKSPSFADGELEHLLEVKFSNSQAAKASYSEGELLLVDAKIKADLETIQKMPLRMKQLLISCSENQNQSCPIYNALKNYQGSNINLMVVYYGYYNFSPVKKDHYQATELTLFGRTFNLRVNAIFVSKVALMETFKTINKVPHLEELNELIIELYEFKRARIKARRLRHSLSKLKKETEERERNASSSRLVKSVNKYGMNATVLGLTAVGVGVVVVIGKIFG